MNELKELSEFVCYKAKMPELMSRIEALNRRAVKLGVAPIVVTVIGEADPVYIRSSVMLDQDGRGVIVGTRERVHVTVEGSAPKFSGWKLLAVLEHTTEGNIIRSVPKTDITLEPYRNTPNRCEHCNVNRHRIDTYLVQHETTGAIKQVGSSCLADFLGHTNPKELAALAELWFSVREIFGGSYEDEDYSERGDKLVWVASALRLAACSIRTRGYVSRKKAEETFPPPMTTKEDVLFSLFPPSGLTAKQREEQLLHPTEADKEFAEKALEFVRGFEGKSDLSDFSHNLLTVAKREAVEPRDLGIGCYIVEAYRRFLEQQVTSGPHFGEIGKRYKDVSVKFLGAAGSFESQYGTMFFYVFQVPEQGARLKWKTSVVLDYQAGEQLMASFSVKEHGEWKGQKETTVSRCALSKVAD